MTKIEYAFEYYDIYVIKCVSYAQKRLGGYAKELWLQIQKDRLSFGKDQFQLGQKWKTYFLKIYYLNMQVKCELAYLCYSYFDKRYTFSIFLKCFLYSVQNILKIKFSPFSTLNDKE